VWVARPPLPVRRGWHEVPISEENARSLVALANAVTVRPDLASLWSAAGDTCAANGFHGLAVERYRRALAMEPDHPEDRDGLAGSLMATGRLTEAVAEYRELFARFPGYAGTHPRALVSAARCAALLATEAEEGQALTADQRRELRLAALGWLRAWVRASPQDEIEAVRLSHDPALRGVREWPLFAALPSNEMPRWTALWDDVRAVYARSPKRYIVDPPPVPPADAYPIAPLPRAK
jgi:tetratricopeptide (TPR) repeat protein